MAIKVVNNVTKIICDECGERIMTEFPEDASDQEVHLCTECQAESWQDDEQIDYDESDRLAVESERIEQQVEFRRHESEA